MSRQNLILILSDMLSNRCTPENILSLSSNEVFVFGTNPDGEHKSNAAKLAMKEFGAKKGEGEGLGSSAENQKFYFGHTKFGMNVDEMSSKQ